MTAIAILVATEQPTIRFAAAELQRYLAQATGRPVGFDAVPAATTILRIGLAHDLPTAPPLPTPADPRFDDVIGIAVAASGGVIVGNNPRSVLLAVYRYLHLLGCRWVRPGIDGEYIPSLDLANSPITVVEQPRYRHRGICIEGAVSFEHVRDLIDWMPKVGLNAYFVQFREAFTFFERWYAHRGDPAEPGHFSVAEARTLVARVAAEVKQRDMLYHAVGHGWTCEPFGIAGLGWDYPPEPVPAEAIPYLALVNGARELWQGIPLNTSLCYSNPAVRRIMTDAAVGYAQQHPEVDLLHVWLADGTNNQCECAECAGTRPSDWYVLLLNELDAKLSAVGLDVRIVFLAYFDLLWPPEQQRIRNLDRFVMMFAPITRTYTRPFSPTPELPPLRPFERNRLDFPQDIAQNLAFLRAWQAQCIAQDGRPIDSFDFDYHLMWDHYRDPGYTQTAHILRQDLDLLGDLGLNGFISCQVQRAFFPTGLPMVLLGWASWGASTDEATLAADYFAAAFGPEGSHAQAYLAQISQLFDPAYLRGEKPDAGVPAAAALAQVAGVVDQFLPTIERNMMLDTPCWARSWFYLQHHAAIVNGLAAALHERALGHERQAYTAWVTLREHVRRSEPAIHPVFDTYLFVRVWDAVFRIDHS